MGLLYQSYQLRSALSEIVSLVKFLRRSVDGKHLMCFQSETSVFKFRRSVDGASVSMGEFETQLYMLSCNVLNSPKLS